MTTDLVPIDAEFQIQPTQTLQSFAIRITELREFTKLNMQEGVDYGVIPGTPKPTLFKPGAEKLMRWNGLVVDMNIEPTSTLSVLGDVIDVDIAGKVRHAGTGTMLGTVHANANSEERRYKNQRTGNKPQTIADQKNTIIKMAEKRALVAAALLYTMASEVYTQDLEDGVGGDDPPKPQSAPKSDAKVYPCPKCGKPQKEKHGETNGKPWTRYFCSGSHRVKEGEEWIEKGCDWSTFDKREAGRMDDKPPEPTPSNGTFSPEESAERTKLITQMKRRAEEQLVSTDSSLMDKPDEITKKIKELTGTFIGLVHGSVVPMSQLTLAEMRQVVEKMSPTPEEEPDAFEGQ